MTRRTERLLWIVSALLLVIAVFEWRMARPLIVTAQSATQRLPLPVMMFADAPLATAESRATEHDPFRIDRHPAAIAFGDTAAAAAAAGIPRPPTPASGFMLKGIIGGPPWQAILAGVPGRNGMIVVRAGDTLTGLRVRHVQRDGITLASRDSLITLTLQRAWQ